MSSLSYDEMIKSNPELEGIIHKKSWDYIKASDDHTVGWLLELWRKNVRLNKKLFKKHKSIKDCKGLCHNKAIIGVGAGQSFNKNKDVLKRIVDGEKGRIWNDRRFVIIASNHQYKPMLKLGIIPDFVILADGSDVVMDQLTKDVPESGQNTMLIAGAHCSYDVLKKWDKQGKKILFYVPMTEGVRAEFKKVYNKHPRHHAVHQGGNVLNTAWSIGLSYFGSTVFMAVGNDLSYELKTEEEDQRNSYYADGDYSSNLANQRDDAKGGKRWMGFSLKKKVIWTGEDRYDIEIEPVGTSPALWVYKTWLESQVVGNPGARFHYYNCTEGGIAGVMCKGMEDEELVEESNWHLLDEKCDKWHTTTLEDAANKFLTAKGAM